MSKKREEKKTTWSHHAVRIVFNTAAHPLEYAKVLIQIGHEPIAPRPTTTFFGKPALKLPNIFEYVKYIKSVDGFTGCYRGLMPKICGSLTCVFVNEKVVEILDKNERKNRSSPEIDAEDESENVDPKKKFVITLKRDIISRISAIIVSQPFHVITVRMMAQFVGRETKYDGIFSSITEIYNQNGILGFFAGLIPRIVGDVLFILLASSLTYMINSYVVEDPELKSYTSATMTFVASAITYPFQVVSNCMAVMNSGLYAGRQPFMPIYNTWIDCWSDLSRRNQLKRGSSVLIRYYVGPQLVINGRAVPVPRNDLRSFD